MLSRTQLVEALLAVMLWHAPVLADKWRFPSELVTTSENFGDVRLSKEIDGRKDQQSPIFSVHFERAGFPKVSILGVSFEQAFASSDGKYILGLSNYGLPGTAAMLFDHEGNLLLTARHGQLKVTYCEKSVTLVRVWYDANTPSVEFKTDAAGSLLRLYIKGCDGRTIDLHEAAFFANLLTP